MLSLNHLVRGCGALAIITLSACGNNNSSNQQAALTAADAQQFLAEAQADLQQLQLQSLLSFQRVRDLAIQNQSLQLFLI